MKIIDGKTLAQNLRKNIANEVKQYSRPPGLAVEIGRASCRERV